MKEKILSLLLCFGFVAAANETAGVIKVQNPEALLKKISLFLSRENPSVARKFDLQVTPNILIREISPLNLKLPVTAYYYFSNNNLQPVVFGTLRQGKKPLPIRILFSQELVPEVRKNNQVVYADPKFKPQIKDLQEDAIKLPKELVAGQYFFRVHETKSSRRNSGYDLADFLTKEISKFSFSIDFPAEDLLNIEFELEAKKNSGLFQFSNKSRRRLPAPFILANPEYYCFLTFPADQTAVDWLMSTVSEFYFDFANDEHIYGCFLHSVATEEHATAITLSKEQDFYLLSGILSAEKKEHFENFLKTHGDSSNGKIYKFHNSSGSNVYVMVSGNRANLLIRKQIINEQRVSQTFKSLKPAAMPLGERTFLSASIRKSDGTYAPILAGTMANGKFRFIANLPPVVFTHVIPDLLMVEDLIP